MLPIFYHTWKEKLLTMCVFLLDVRLISIKLSLKITKYNKKQFQMSQMGSAGMSTFFFNFLTSQAKISSQGS